MEQVTMANCSCCSRDVSVPSEKKGRRHLSSPTLVSKLKILLELVKEKMPASGPALDVERYVEDYICRHCVGLLKNFEDHRRKLTDIIENILHKKYSLAVHLPQPPLCDHLLLLLPLFFNLRLLIQK